jgi:hypothetical protein
MPGEGSNASNMDTPLTLRVRGGARDGQVIKLSAAKCTIGSSRGCTLRLHGRDVRPVHCLIVRGKAQTVVRRWSAETLLNGESFEDKQLVLGDLLRCGPVEFEVVPESGESCGRVSAPSALAAPVCNLFGTQVLPNSLAGASPSATQLLPSADDSHTVALPNFRPSLAESQPLNSTQPIPIADGSQTAVLSGWRPSAASSDSQDMHATVAIKAASDALAGREAELARREKALADLEERTAKAGAQQDSRERALLDRETELARQESSLQQREEQIASREREAPTADNAEVDIAKVGGADAAPSDASENAAEAEARRSIAEEREAVEKAKRELAAEHALREAEHKRWQEDHRQWKAQRKAAEDQMEGLHAQVEHQLAEIMARRKHLDQDRDAWKTEHDVNRRQLEDRAAEVARQAEEVENWRKELEAQRQKAAKLIEETSRYEQLVGELAETRASLVTREKELTDTREEIARLVAENDAARTAANQANQATSTAQQQYHEKLSQLEQQAEDLLRIRTDFERDRAEWEQHRRENGGSETNLQRRDGEADATTRTRASDSPSNLSTWALLKDRMDVADDEAVEEPLVRSHSERSSPTRPEAVGEDEESIERYMASLMDRVGGRSTSGVAQAPSADPVRDSATRSAVMASLSETSGEDAAPPEAPKPVVRRAQTVTAENVAAMRELANLNARVAITRHGAKQMVPNLLAKATMSAVAFGLAAAMHVVNTQQSMLQLVGSAACALVGAMFAARTITTMAELFRSRRGIAGDDAAAPNAGANPSDAS